MINIDQYIVEFVMSNPVTVMLAIGLLKGIAILIPGVKDDKIITLLSNMINGIRPKNIKKAVKS